MYRPQPGVVYCQHHGCTDSPDDLGTLYVNISDLAMICDVEGVTEYVERLLREHLPNYPADRIGQPRGG